MSTDLLRRAASKLRDHATAAAESRPAPWFEGPYDPCPKRGVFPAYGSDPIAEVAERDQRPVVASYLALMHPPVALALAAWLDEAAAWWGKEVRFAERVVLFPGAKAPEDWPASKFTHALAVARAVLREPGDTPGGAS